MSATPNKYITPVFDTVLDKAIAHVQDSLFQGNPFQAWRSIRALIYATGDKKIQDELEKDISEVEAHIKAIINKRSYTQSDNLEKHQTIQAYLQEKTLLLFQKIMLTLDANDYFHKRSGIFMQGKEIV